MSDEIWYGDIAAWPGFNVTSTSVDSAYPLSRVNDRFPSLVFRTAANGNQYITFNGTTSIEVIGCALINTNLTAADTIQAQYSNNDFSPTLGTQNLIVKSYTRRKWDEYQKRTISYIRSDAYAAHSWSLKDFRILMNSSTIAQYEVGKVLLFTQRYIFQYGSRNDYDGGYQVESRIIESDSGTMIKENKFIRHNFSFDFPYTTKLQADSFADIAIEPYAVYFADGLNGAMLFGAVETDIPKVRDKYGNGKRVFTGRFTEII